MYISKSKTGLKELLNKPDDFQCKYQFLGCFYTLLKLSFSSSVCATERQLSLYCRKLLNSASTSKDLNESQVSFYRQLIKDVKEHLPSTLKKTDPDKLAATKLPNGISIFEKHLSLITVRFY